MSYLTTKSTLILRRLGQYSNKSNLAYVTRINLGQFHAQPKSNGNKKIILILTLLTYQHFTFGKYPVKKKKNE